MVSKISEESLLILIAFLGIRSLLLTHLHTQVRGSIVEREVLAMKAGENREQKIPTPFDELLCRTLKSLVPQAS